MRIHALTTKEAAKPGLVPPLRTPALRSILLGAGAQPKLRVGAVDDPAEAEADRVADKIMCMPDPGLAATASEPPRDQRSILRRKCVQCEEEEKIQRKEMQGPSYAGGALSPAAEVAVNSLGTGAPLPASERAFFEPRFGHSLGHVRVHDGAQAAHAASAVNARAFALGSSVAFARGEYQPGTRGGRELMAHELAHVGSVSTWTRNEHLRRRAHVEEIVHSTEFLEGGWSDVNELGIVYKEGTLETGGGVFLRASPGGEKIEWLAQNTKVYILKHSAKHKAYAVSVVSADGKSGKFGYVAESHVWRNLPDPDSNVLKIEPGQSPVEIAGAHYAGKGFDVWGKDKRYVVNALVWVNQQAQHNAKGKSGVSKEAVDDGWYASKSIAGVYIWLPGVEFMNAIYNSVAKRGGGTGSITADIWQSVKNFASKIAYGLAFVGGLLHGFAKSLWDAVAGLVTTVKDVLVSIFTGNVLSDAKELWNAISGITWEQIKEAVGAWADKWEKELNSPSPWTAGHAHGYLTGYIMAEAAQLLLTGGTLTAAKGALWVSRLGKAIKTTRAFVSFEKGLAKAGEVGSATKKVVGAVSNTIAKSKPFTLLADARHWIGKALMLSAETLKDLALPAINRLRTLSDDALEALQKFAEPFKRVILGCASPCKVDLDVIKTYLAGLTAKTGAKVDILNSVDSILAALPKKLNKSQIKSKLKAHPAFVDAMKAAELTADDLMVIEKFITPADLADAASAYRTFTRTVSSLIPAKVGRDMNKLNLIAEAMILMEPRWGSAFKGPIFESFAKFHLGRFRNLSFSRSTWQRSRHKSLSKVRRTSDGFIESAGAIWDFKHTIAKVPTDQVDDYFRILTRKMVSEEGHTAKSVNFLFATKEGAEKNADLVKKGFSVFYVKPPDVVTQL